MYKLYILKSINYLKTYVGITDNLKRRLKEHNLGKNIYSRKYVPWKIIYNEECENIQIARRREKYFKSCTGRKKIRKILDIGE